DITPDGVMHLSQAGIILQEAILYEAKRPSPVELKRYCIMPEHLHLRLYLNAGQQQALRHQGQFISNLKFWSAKKCNEIGIKIAWQENYHDYLCLSREIIQRVDEYIDLNSQKWALMHSENPPMGVVEPIYSPLLPTYEWWSGVGNTQLLNGTYRLLAIRLSRQIPISSANGIIAALLNECKKGYVPISTFISPIERILFKQLGQSDIPIINAVPDQLKSIYRPTVEQNKLFAQGRLLIISHLQEASTAREKCWHNINDDIAKMAYASHGNAIYWR
ncbi:MAG: hypothetical protein IJS08_17040, partial [Victivallales bacterium]|nr:hypothetical protein [Victivallales bacterium]